MDIQMKEMKRRLVFQVFVDQEKQQYIQQKEQREVVSIEALKSPPPLLIQILKLFMHGLLDQFHELTYNVNLVLRNLSDMLQTEGEGVELDFVKREWKEIELWGWQLAVSPRSWVRMLEHEEIYASADDTVDLHVFTTKIYKIIIQEGLKSTPRMGQYCGLVSAQVFFFLQEVSLQICRSYEHGRAIIRKRTQSVQEILKQSIILNFYVLYKVLLQLSTACESEIVGQLQAGIFKNIQYSYSSRFANYILEKHQILSMSMLGSSGIQSIQSSSNPPPPLIKVIERMQATSQAVKWRQAVREDGKRGIIVQMGGGEGEEGEESKYVLTMGDDEVEVMNCNSMRMHWQVSEAALQNYQVTDLVQNKKALAQKLRQSPTELKQLTLTDHVSTVGGSLGKCLASIKNYESFGAFALDLSKRTVISGSFNLVATSVPLLGLLFATGGYTYTFYYIFSNRFASKKKKIQDIGFMTLDTASSIGSGLIGATIGQAVIPIPLLGAFVGGFIGGFIGEIGWNKLSQSLQTIRFKQTVKQLQSRIQPKGYWQVNKETLHILGLNRENFYNTIPPQIQCRLGADKVWFAMIGFCLLSFYYSKERAKFMQKKIALLKKNKKKEQQYSIIYQTDIEQQYEPSLDLLCIMKYLQYQKVGLLDCYVQLEEFIGQMFSRLK